MNNRRTITGTIALLALASFAAVAVGCTPAPTGQGSGGATTPTVEATAPVTTAVTTAVTATSSVPTAPVSEKSEAVVKALEPDVAKQGAFIKSFKKVGGVWTATVDYLTWTAGTGQEGDWGEWGNQSKKLRTIPVAANAKIVVTKHNADGTEQPFVTIPLSSFAAHLATHPRNNIDWDAWWLTVKNGKITRIEEHWIP